MEKFKRKPKKTFAEKAKGVFVVEGLNAVAEYLKFKPQSVEFIVYKENMLSDKALFHQIETLKIKSVEAEKYNEEETGQYSRAPIWASVRVEVRGDEAFAELEGVRGRRILVLDHITDPRNLGALMRTAAFFGIKEVIAAKDRQVLLTQSSVATAQGAFALCELIAVTNLSRAIKHLKKHSFWVVGSAPNGVPMTQLTQLTEEDNLLIVMGSEEKGMSRLIEGLCDWIVSIEGVGESLNSLNVSVAAGIVVHQICQKQKKP